jgi:hypothetical protein
VAGARLIAPGALRGLAIELLFRLAIGGFWGSLLQGFAAAQPARLAGFWMVVLLLACSHGFEYLFLRAGGAAHAGVVTGISVVFTMLSLFVNWSLMRQGVLLTGPGASSLGSDLRWIFGGLLGER